MPQLHLDILKTISRNIFIFKTIRIPNLSSLKNLINLKKKWFSLEKGHDQCENIHNFILIIESDSDKMYKLLFRFFFCN